MSTLEGETHNINSRKVFAKIVDREIARANRSGLCFSIVNFSFRNSKIAKILFKQLINILSRRLRLTDEIGWIDDEHIGVLLYNTNLIDAYNFAKNIQKKQASTAFPLDYEIFIYPQKDQKRDSGDQITDLNLNDGVTKTVRRKWRDPQSSIRNIKNAQMPPVINSNSKMLKGYANLVQHIKPVYKAKMPIWKRCIDIIGAVFGLAITLPILILISGLIKTVSHGTILFKQERIGYAGKKFTFFKFRTMKMDVDSSAHQQYLSDLINNTQYVEFESPMAKMDADNTQIIPFGRILRKTYLDELPQLINVLRGEMSLVGPRPPIPYEVEEYRWWHKGRFDAVPGMTGLWQVSGKNSLTFKEMVRLDIQYSKTVSFMVDLKILLKTPYAIISELIFSFKTIKLIMKGIKQNA
jgi:lipopolysaccharide/colanic/teichoic acid biosynthesis glycosyltransferase